MRWPRQLQLDKSLPDLLQIFLGGCLRFPGIALDLLRKPSRSAAHAANFAFARSAVGWSASRRRTIHSRADLLKARSAEVLRSPEIAMVRKFRLNRANQEPIAGHLSLARIEVRVRATRLRTAAADHRPPNYPARLRVVHVRWASSSSDTPRAPFEKLFPRQFPSVAIPGSDPSDVVSRQDHPCRGRSAVSTESRNRSSTSPSSISASEFNSTM